MQTHLFAERASLLAHHESALAARLTRESLTRAAARIPEDFLLSAFPGDDPERVRAMYPAFLWKRLKEPRPFVT